MKETKIHLIRHGETDWNAQSRIQGSIERDLSQVGVYQSLAVGQHFAGIPISAIYSSQQRRAVQTAALIASHHHYEPKVHEAFCEGNYGSLEGMTQKQFIQDFGDALEEAHKLPAYERIHHKVVDDSESTAELAERAIKGLREIIDEHPGGDVVVVTHGWLMRALLVVLGFYDDRRLLVKNGAIVTLVGNDTMIRVAGFQGVELKPTSWKKGG